MLLNIIFWGAIIYVGLIVIWRIFLAVMMIIEMRAVGGLSGALMAAGFNLLMGIWDFAKFAFFILIVAFVFRTYVQDKIDISETADIQTYITKIKTIIDATTKYNDAYIELGRDSKDSISIEEWAKSWDDNIKEYKSLYQRGEYIISEAIKFDAIYHAAQEKVKKTDDLYKDSDQDVKLMLKLLLEQLDTGNKLVKKIILFVQLRNEIFNSIIKIGPIDSINKNTNALKFQRSLDIVAENEIRAWQILTEVIKTHQQFEDLNKERLKLFERQEQ